MNRKEGLANWIAERHQGQIKKYISEPYFSHLLRVAERSDPVTMLGYEIGLCHDLLEDTPVTDNELFEALLCFGYDDMEANYITTRVVELTDVFTAVAYPGLRRTERKAKEAKRLAGISSGAQTVKYSDSMDCIVKHDSLNALTYLQRKRCLMEAMNDGFQETRQQVLSRIDEAISGLS